MVRSGGKAFVVLIAAVQMVLMAGPAGADELTVEEFERKLDQRDQMIDALLKRVQALERRAGAESREAATETAAEMPPAPDEAPAAGIAEAEPEAAEAGAEERLPGEVVVGPEEAERALERSLVEAGGLLLRPGRLEVQPSLRYARQEDAASTFITLEGTTFVGQRERYIDDITADLSLRLGLPFDSQLELGLPWRWRSVDNVREVNFSPVGASSATGSGFGNLRVGLAKTLLRERHRRPDVIGRVTWDTRTGTRQDDGVSISSDFDELRGSLTAIKRQDPLVFLGSLSYEHVFERDDVQPGAAFTATIGSFVALSPETSMRFFLSQSFRRETELRGDRMSGSDQTAATLSIGGSTLLARGVLLNLSVGVGLTRDADDYSVRLGLPIRFNRYLGSE